ncbi:hypothetical protein [Actinocorallia populi]|uniref:hypothetical protein n=1 Tax=Actinocorallia populi TaxID=2079200 RepID=UPI000D092008|nr:hypothetical protein [Actinocorallia populi]
MAFSTEFRLAVDMPRRALVFYRRHLPVIGGISLIPGLERFVSVQADLSGFVPVLLEVLTTAVRVVLLAVIARLAFREEPVRPKGDPGRFLDERWPSLVLQSAMLVALTAVFNILPERVFATWVPDGAEDLYLAVLLLVKNVTVIAFAFVWVVLCVREALTYAPPAPGPSAAGAAPPR